MMKSSEERNRGLEISCGFAGLILVVGFLLGGLSGSSTSVMAQTEGWSEPGLLSTNTANSWWSDVAVDGAGRAYVVWMSGRSGRTGEGVLDLLMYSTWDGRAWSEPNDIILTARGGYTIRPAIAVDANGTLHITYRGTTQIYHTSTPTANAWNASAWGSSYRISGSGNGYYSDVAVDSTGAIHVVWNESVTDNPDEKALWVGTSGGVSTYDGEVWHLHGSQAGLDGHEIYTILESPDGAQWLGTASGAVRFDGATWKTYTVQDGLPDEHVYAVAQDSDGVIWFGTGNGVGRYDAQPDALEWSTYTTMHGLADNRVTAIGVYEGRLLWFGTAGGVSRYDGRMWINYTVAEGLADNSVTALVVDSEGKVWIGTENGVSRYDGQAWVTYTTRDGLSDNHVTALALDQEGGVWVGTRHGVSRYDSRQWLTYTTDDGLANNHVTALAVDSEGVLWAGTERGLSRYDGYRWITYTTRDGLVSDQVTAIAEDRILNAACSNCADVFYRRSTDGGQTWSLPVNLSKSYPGSVKPQIRIDSRDGVHVVWEEGEDWYAAAGYPVASVHRYSPDAGNTWARPTVFSAPGDTPQQITLGVGREGELIVVWRLVSTDGIFYQRSTDNGGTWSEPTRIPGVEAKEWLPMSLDGCDAATDSDGNVHLLVLGRLSSDVEKEKEVDLSVLHIEWDGEQWLPAKKVFTSIDPPEWPRIAIGRGNKLFATWFTRDKEHIWDSARGRYQVWAAYSQSRSSAQTPVPFPTVGLAPTFTPQSNAPSAATPFPALASEGSGLPSGLDTERDELLRLAIALSPIGALILVVVFIRFGWVRRAFARFLSRFR
jgi:hypothetical protein